MTCRNLLITTALTEVGAAVMLLGNPALFVYWLLGGEPLEAPDALLIGRFAGAALLAIGVACWLSREGRDAAGLLAGVLVYDAAAAGLLAYGAVALHRTGVVLWPAVVLHGMLALWCVRLLQSNENDAGAAASANLDLENRT